MILNDAEHEKYYKKRKSNRSLPLVSEQYEVKFRNQNPDGYWSTLTARYHGTSKADHDEVEKKWRTEYPDGDLIHVSYL